jgi:hypothetical protein
VVRQEVRRQTGPGEELGGRAVRGRELVDDRQPDRIAERCVRLGAHLHRRSHGAILYLKNS